MHLVDGGQVAVCVSEGGVDLNGARVALQRSLHILHLLQSVAHVGVGVRKRRADPGAGQTIK